MNPTTATHPDSYESRCQRAAYELRLMLGTGVLNLPMILAILEEKR